MGNHNILKTNTKGERFMVFPEGVRREDCVKWLEEYGPAPLGWLYQITNLDRKKKKNKRPDHVKLSGFTQAGDLVDTIKTAHKSNFGWYTIKMGKRDLRKRGASYFMREKVWSTGESDGSPV